MKKINHSATKKFNTMIWFVAVLFVSFALSNVIEYIYHNYSSKALADTSEEPEDDETEDGLKYQQISVSPGDSDDELITLDGMMPVSADVTVESGDTSPDDTLCSYDITITDTVGNSFQPKEESPITVEITNNAISGYDESTLHLWHIDEAGIREEVTEFTVDGDSIRFEATGFSLYEISQGDPQLCTYVFYTPDSNGVYRKYYYMTTTGKQICQQIIKDSDSLMPPQLPANDANYTFIGWYILEGDENALSATDEELLFDDPQDFTDGGTVRIGAVYADCVYLIFHDQYNSQIESYPIVGTRRGTLENGTAKIDLDGIEVTYDDEEENTHMVFKGWSEQIVEPGESAPLIGYTENNKLFYDISVNKDVYPVFERSAWLTFSTGGIAEGADSVPMQIISVDTPLGQLPVPERTGYSFGGWYADSAATSMQISYANGNLISGATVPDTMEWDNGDLYLTGDTKLYAKWTEAATNYSVVIWRQNVNDAANAADYDKTYDYAESFRLSATTGSTVSVSSTYQGYGGSGNYTGFHYRTCDSAKTVAADGSTVLNVYYDRNVHTLTFKSGNTTIQTITGLYGAYINDYFPIDGDANCHWKADRTDIYKYILVTLETMPDSDVIFDKTSANAFGTIYYYVEIDESDASEYSVTKHFNYNGEQLLYGLYKTAQHPFTYLTYNEEYHPIDGYYRDSTLAEPYFGEEGRNVGTNNTNSNYYSQDDRAPIGGYTRRTTESNVNYMYYNRNTYNLKFYNSENNNIIATESIKYTQRTESFIPDAPEAPTGKQFAGWFADPGCTTRVFFHTPSQAEIDSTKDNNGVPHYQVYEKMPSHNLVVYAGWEKLWYLVEIDPNGGEFELQSTGNDNSGYSTWFWVNYGDIISEYKEVTRDYETSSEGTYFYKYYDREYYQLGDEYESREDSITERSAGYTQNIMEATDFEHTYELSEGAYRYAGWYKVDKQSGAETLYNFDNPVESNTFLRLHWKAVGTYYIQYNPAGGVLDENDKNEAQFKTLDTADYADKAQVIIMRTVVEAPEGKNFIGWRLRNDPSGTIYYPGGTFEFNAAYAETRIDENGNERKYMTLDAVYQEIDVPSVIYDANGGTMTSTADHGSGTFLKNVSHNNGVTTETELTDSEKYQYNVDAGRLTVRNLENNKPITLSDGTGFSYTYSNTDYIFGGWNTEPDGSGIHYDAGSNLYHIDTEGDNPVILYAEWKIRVYFDKNNDDAGWGGDWTGSADHVYVWDSARNQYYTEISINSMLDEPSYTPVAADSIFCNWSTTQYAAVEDNEPFDFSEPVTQERISAESSGQYLTLYAIWDTLPEITLHAVDSSNETLVLKDEAWLYAEHLTVSSDSTELITFNDVQGYADPAKEGLTGYKYAFACVSDSLGNVSDEKRINDIYYNVAERSVYVTYANGTEEPLANGEEIYLIYYDTVLPIGYVAMGTDGSITEVAVSNSAPVTAAVNGIYKIADNLTTPLSYPTLGTNNYYSYAVGDEFSAQADSSVLHMITGSSNTNNAPRPTLWVRDTWRGFEYSTNGNTWVSAGYDPQLYVVYYPSQPTIVNLNEKTVGFPEDMDKKFTYHVTIKQQEKQFTVDEYYYDDNGSEHHLDGSESIYGGNSFGTVLGGAISNLHFSSQNYANQSSQASFAPPVELSSNTVELSNEQVESFALLYNTNESMIQENATYGDHEALYCRTGFVIGTYHQIQHRKTTYIITQQIIEIVQEAEEDFTTTMTQSPANGGTIYQDALTYTYTAPTTPTTQNITYTNSRESAPVEVHVAIAKGNGYYEHDEYRTDTENDYKADIARGSTLTLLDRFSPEDLLDTEDNSSYVFAGIVYGEKQSYDNQRIDVAGSDTESITFGLTDSDNIYDLYLDGNTDNLLGDYEIYYVYYKVPTIIYCIEGSSGTLVPFDPPLTINGSEVTLNGGTVVQNSQLPLDTASYYSNGEFLISQAIRNGYKIPPVLDYAGGDVPVEYAFLGVGPSSASRISDLQYSEGKELRMSVEDGIVKYRFNAADTAEPLDSADDLVVYAIYKGGNKLTISKTINRVRTKVGYPTFQYRIRRVADGNGVPLSAENSEESVIAMSFTSSGTMNSEFVKLPVGTYEITELSNINYTLSDISVSPGEAGETEGATATVTIGARSEVIVSFTNSINSNDKKTYQTFTDNHIDYTGQ
ncbi:InlB B-repeat-containing protein [Ruminococcus sp.]|uniref:InlB B-repeat-containing protein n=1 Tax=Ruminococcus sp. TaxID=41978 RepID=UPI0025F6CEF0|nr:InlB B-repeat-containing protein [Ruminococcus sp.]